MMEEEVEMLGTPAEVRTSEMIAVEIRTLQRQAVGMALNYAVEIGRRLEEAKAMIPHGAWGEWLKRELNYSQSSAQNFMRVFREYGEAQQNLFGGAAKSQTFGNLTYSKAVRLLAVPEEDREEFLAQHDVDSMSTRKLEQAIKARDEAKREAEKKLRQVMAEKEELQAELQEAEGRLKTASPEVTEFRVRFDAWQEEYNKMMDALEAVSDSELKERLGRAVQTAIAQWAQGEKG